MFFAFRRFSCRCLTRLSVRLKERKKMKNEWGKVIIEKFSSSCAHGFERKISFHFHILICDWNPLISFEYNRAEWTLRGDEDDSREIFFFVAISEHENIINNTQKREANKKINQKRALNEMMSVALDMFYVVQIK